MSAAIVPDSNYHGMVFLFRAKLSGGHQLELFQDFLKIITEKDLYIISKISQNNTQKQMQFWKESLDGKDALSVLTLSVYQHLREST